VEPESSRAAGLHAVLPQLAPPGMHGQRLTRSLTGQELRLRGRKPVGSRSARDCTAVDVR